MQNAAPSRVLGVLWQVLDLRMWRDGVQYIDTIYLLASSTKACPQTTTKLQRDRWVVTSGTKRAEGDDSVTTQHDKAKRIVMWVCLVLFALIAATYTWPNVRWFFVRCWFEGVHWVDENILYDCDWKLS